MIEIICVNNGERRNYPQGTTLQQVAVDMGFIGKPVYAAYVNNKIKELDFALFNPYVVEFIDFTYPDGKRMYDRSLSFVLYKAVHDILPGHNLKIEHSISNGYYCEIEGIDSVTEEQVAEIDRQMRHIIELDLPFIRKRMLADEASKLFDEFGYHEKSQLLKTRAHLYSSVYYLDDVIDYFYGCLLPSTGYLKVFSIDKYYDGMLLRAPYSDNPNAVAKLEPQDKMFDVLHEFKKWGRILNISYMSNINQHIDDGSIGELIKISEALQEKKLAQIADMIATRTPQPRLVLLSGPSSSGKTTTANKLAIQLKVAGYTPVTLSLDNYFVDRELTPRDENGEYDFEALEALDIPYLNNDLNALFEGKTIDVPKFSFKDGKRFFDGEKMHLDANSIIIAEGIHALNPKLTAHIDDSLKFRVYVSALTTLSLDNHNRIPTTDTRLIRRIVRDYRYRGYSAKDTIDRWPSVRRGEDKHIFPNQERADIMFNTAMVYETGVLKRYVEPVLQQVPPNCNAYREALRLLKFLSYVQPIPDNEIPPTSVLREFFGGSSFKY